MSNELIAVLQGMKGGRHAAKFAAGWCNISLEVGCLEDIVMGVSDRKEIGCVAR